MTRKSEWIGLKSAEKYHDFEQLKFTDQGTGRFNQLLKKTGDDREKHDHPEIAFLPPQKDSPQTYKIVPRITQM
jgi:hypothetical protein